MLTRPIPSTGETIPVIGLGSWQTFDLGGSASERAPAREVIRSFVAGGGKLIDSSPMYGRSETVIGDILGEEHLRPQVFVATKVWITGKQAGIAQMEESMRRLRADPIDLLQVHNLVDVGTHLETLRRWKREGRVRYLGITHYTASSHDEVASLLASETLDFVQINYSAAERDAERRVLPAARDRGVAVIVNRPFAKGGLLRRVQSQPLPVWAAELQVHSWAQLMLKFVISHPAVTCVIPATSRVEHLRDNLGAGTGPLPDEKLRARIAAALG
jgi:aryl-alcohol dehydrogenase-like predicted oxidoreductase